MDGAGCPGGVAVVLEAGRPILIGKARPYTLSLYSLWPSLKAKTFEGLIYQMLLRIDYRLSNDSYEQAPLPVSVS